MRYLPRLTPREVRLELLRNEPELDLVLSNYCAKLKTVYNYCDSGLTHRYVLAYGLVIVCLLLIGLTRARFNPSLLFIAFITGISFTTEVIVITVTAVSTPAPIANITDYIVKDAIRRVASKISAV